MDCYFGKTACNGSNNPSSTMFVVLQNYGYKKEAEYKYKGKGGVCDEKKPGTDIGHFHHYVANGIMYRYDNPGSHKAYEDSTKKDEVSYTSKSGKKATAEHMNITNHWVTHQIDQGGVLSTAIYATNSFKLFFGGMYYVSECLKEDVPNHAVNIVGYNNDVYKF